MRNHLSIGNKLVSALLIASMLAGPWMTTLARADDALVTSSNAIGQQGEKPTLVDNSAAGQYMIAKKRYEALAGQRDELESQCKIKGGEDWAKAVTDENGRVIIDCIGDAQKIDETKAKLKAQMDALPVEAGAASSCLAPSSTSNLTQLAGTCAEATTKVSSCSTKESEQTFSKCAGSVGCDLLNSVLDAGAVTGGLAVATVNPLALVLGKLPSFESTKQSVRGSLGCPVTTSTPSCLTSIIGGVVASLFDSVNMLWDTLKLGWGLVKGIARAGVNAAVGAARWAGNKAVSLWNWVTGVEDATSDKMMMASQQTPASVSSFNRDPWAWLKGVVDGTGEGISSVGTLLAGLPAAIFGFFSNGIRDNFMCEEWSGPPFASKCSQSNAWNCASCGQMMSAMCGVGGYMGGLLLATLTGTVVTDAVGGAAASVARVAAPHAAEIAARLAETFPGVAKVASNGYELAKVAGKVVGSKVLSYAERFGAYIAEGTPSIQALAKSTFAGIKWVAATTPGKAVTSTLKTLVVDPAAAYMRWTEKSVELGNEVFANTVKTWQEYRSAAKAKEAAEALAKVVKVEEELKVAKEAAEAAIKAKEAANLAVKEEASAKAFEEAKRTAVEHENALQQLAEVQARHADAVAKESVASAAAELAHTKVMDTTLTEQIKRASADAEVSVAKAEESAQNAVNASETRVLEEGRLRQAREALKDAETAEAKKGAQKEFNDAIARSEAADKKYLEAKEAAAKDIAEQQAKAEVALQLQVLKLEKKGVTAAELRAASSEAGAQSRGLKLTIDEKKASLATASADEKVVLKSEIAQAQKELTPLEKQARRADFDFKAAQGEQEAQLKSAQELAERSRRLTQSGLGDAAIADSVVPALNSAKLKELAALTGETSTKRIEEVKGLLQDLESKLAQSDKLSTAERGLAGDTTVIQLTKEEKLKRLEDVYRGSLGPNKHDIDVMRSVVRDVDPVLLKDPVNRKINLRVLTKQAQQGAELKEAEAALRPLQGDAAALEGDAIVTEQMAEKQLTDQELFDALKRDGLTEEEIPTFAKNCILPKRPNFNPVGVR